MMISHPANTTPIQHVINKRVFVANTQIANTANTQIPPTKGSSLSINLTQSLFFQRH